MIDDPTRIREVATELVKLVRDAVPGPVPYPQDELGRWQHMVGPAILCRSAGTLASMTLLLPDRHMIDALVLLRALYESIVTFAWIATEPAERVERWVASCKEDEIHTHNDWSEAGRPVRSPEEIAEYENSVRETRNKFSLARVDARGKWKDALVPGVDVMAMKCDRHWGGVVRGWSPESRVGDPGDITGWHSSLRGLYRWIYRMGSSATHTGHRSLDPFVTADGARLMVHSEDIAATLIPYGLGCYLLGLEIGVAEQAFGWPEYERAAQILGVYDSLFAQITGDGRGG
jgi:hypothetical protein